MPTPCLLNLPVHRCVFAVCKRVTDVDYLLCAACGVLCDAWCVMC